MNRVVHAAALVLLAPLAAGRAATAGDPLDARVAAYRSLGTPLSAALLEIGRSYGITVVSDAPTDASVSLELRNATVRDLLDALTRGQGLYWRREGRLIVVGRNVTRLYGIDYPQLARSAQGGSNVLLSAQSGAAATPTQTIAAAAAGYPQGAVQNDQTNLSIQLQNQNHFWQDLQAEMAGLCRPGEKVSVNPFAGLAVVAAPPARQGDFRAFVDAVNRRISRQVRISARVVEVELNSQHQLGVDWTAAGTAGGLSLAGAGTATSFSTLAGQALVPSTVSGTLADAKISAVIRALQDQGEVRAVSNPSVLTLSNQTAFVKVGTEQTFFSLSNSTTVTSQGSAAGPVTTTQSSYSENAITIGTVLYVTPKLNADDSVTVDVLPAITQLIGVDASPDGQQTAPRMDIKALSTLARLKPREAVMIGGLIYDRAAEESRKVPLLGDLPVVGRAFATNARAKTRSELVIFLTAEPVD